MPQDNREHQAYLSKIDKHIQAHPKDLHSCLQEFKDMVDGDTRLYLLASEMFSEVPRKKPYDKDPTGRKQIKDFDHLLGMLNHIITTGPTWTDKSHRVGVVGVPINTALDWPMGTHAGFAFFLDPKVNAAMKKILNVWGEFLKSSESAYVLEGPDSWFGKHGLRSLTEVANNGSGSKKFEEFFQCDPSKPKFGYTSWDDFFTRKLCDGARPIASPEDDSVIANACESKPYNVQKDVQLRDSFWIKGAKYSVLDMLAHDKLAKEFIGGTVYQAFLSALSYHRWHAPVSGKIVKAFVQDGSYFSEPLFEDFTDTQGADSKSQTVSQAYLTCVATRGVIFIEADNPKIGLMAVILVGMVEVSTCDITVKEGQKITKGDQLGMFHFGGSSHCLLFRKGVDVSGFPEIGGKNNHPVRSKVAVVK